MLNERSVFCEITVPATIPEVWQAWTTESGAESFFSRKCKIDLRPGGAYEMLFNQDAKPEEQGGEGMIIMSIQPEKILSFTWNTPPNLPQVRGQMTHVVVRLFKANPGFTRVTIHHNGWGEGGEWDQAFEYFFRAWGEIVLPRLKYRFEQGPINWDDPPTFD